MSLGQAILDAVKAEHAATDALSNTVTKMRDTVASVVAGVDRLLAAQEITPEQAAEILGTLQADQAEADAALGIAIDSGQALANELAKLPPTDNPPPPPGPPPPPAPTP